MNFSILHPSYKRPQFGPDAARHALAMASGKHGVQYLMCLFVGDPTTLDYYRDAWLVENVHIVLGRTLSCVAQLNSAAFVATGDVLVSMGDDVFLPRDWDAMLAKVIEQYAPADRDYVIAVSDGHPRPDGLITQVVMSMAYYREAGYVIYPEYHAWAGDNDYHERAYMRGKVIEARHIVFEHRHVLSGGPIPMDDTYRIQLDATRAAHGEAVLERRRKERFGVRG